MTNQKKSLEEFEEEVIEAAAMRLRRDGEKQATVAAMLGISQPKISRMENDSKYLTLEWHAIPPEGYEKAEFLDAIDSKLGGDKIRKKIRLLANDPTLKVDILLRDDPSTSNNNGFGPNVSKMLSRLINRVSTCGVTWGPEILPPIEAPNKFVYRDVKENHTPINFLPLCGISGGPLDSLTVSSTVVAMRFDRLVNRGYTAEQRKLYNLNCIPLRHPELKNSSKVKNASVWWPQSDSVRNYISEAFPDYEKIFGEMSMDKRKQTGLVDDVEMIMSSLGSNGDTAKKLLNILFPLDEVIRVKIPGHRQIKIEKQRLLNEIIVGDIAGILLPSDEGKDPEYNQAVVNEINSRLTTLRSHHLLECRKRAKDDAIEKYSRNDEPRPGVVVVALGEERCSALLTAIKLGYVSRVIIDKAAEKKILSLLKSQV